MNDNSGTTPVSNVIYLGDVLHIEASVAVDNHVPLRLYVDSCIATLSDNKDSEPRYAVVDKLGCLMDSKSPDSSSSFTRPALNKLRFDIAAFKFQGDSRSMIYVTCTLRAVNADKPADASNKACSYQKQTYRWVSEDGSSAVCVGVVTPAPALGHPGSSQALFLPGREGATGFLQRSTSPTGAENGCRRERLLLIQLDRTLECM
ncbi:zona pellucida sperm-binding protein 3-like [Acipenser ruthenus]|uniref:zona pellucida sperm-binding protein 3-like n=1 Tax=Acipenser ruthenus TaxID=7906 RepID=UPI0027410C8B|nr:zona pellucida sperm-binding protein 3-like [Acipenser ruthenus]